MAGKKHSALKVGVIVVLILLVLLVVGAWYGVSVFFRTHFYPQTTINGMSVSLADGLRRAVRISRRWSEDGSAVWRSPWRRLSCCPAVRLSGHTGGAAAGCGSGAGGGWPLMHGGAYCAGWHQGRRQWWLRHGVRVNGRQSG